MISETQGDAARRSGAAHGMERARRRRASDDRRCRRISGNFIDTVPIGESDRRKIAYGNAKALYKL
jgi:hypothetical protein